MKKTLFFIACALVLASCGGSADKETKNDTIISPELQKIEQTSVENKNKSEELNKKADSILNNLNKK
jgi:hypothetical protein